jgi:excisionase family DNA binding protein
MECFLVGPLLIIGFSVYIDTYTYKRSKDMSEPEELLTVREVARRLRVDDTTVRRWIKHGTLEAVSLPHVGKRQAYRVRRRTIENLLNQPALPA